MGIMHNINKLSPLKYSRSEFTGAFADLGVLAPIFIASVAINGINPAAFLAIAGLLYISSGIYYRVPMPVQPLKAIAAIAIVSGVGAEVISAAALLMSVILLLLALTGLAKQLSRLFSPPVIRGIQFGVGLMLMSSGLKLITESGTGSGWAAGTPVVNTILVVVTILAVLGFLIFSIRNKFRVSYVFAAIVVIAVGIVLLRANTARLSFFPAPGISFLLPSIANFKTAIWMLVLPQIPLTLGNAVIATKDTAGRYFENRSRRVTERALCFSMGITNLLAGLACGMPLCHGSGGMTAHYAFGARTGGSSVIIGTVCLLLAVTFGASAVEVLRMVPFPVFGVMLFYVGLKHAFLIKDLAKKSDLALAIAIGIAGLLTKNLSLGYAAGMALYHARKLARHIRSSKPGPVSLDKELAGNKPG